MFGIVASLSSKIALIEWVNDEMRYSAALPMALVGLVGLVGTVAVLLA